MKKIIILVIMAIFTSNSSFSSPTHRDQFCQLYAVLAMQVMADRQANQPQSIALQRAKKSIFSKTKNAEEGFNNLVNSAYAYPIETTPNKREQIVNLFSDKAAQVCLAMK